MNHIKYIVLLSTLIIFASCCSAASDIRHAAYLDRSDDSAENIELTTLCQRSAQYSNPTQYHSSTQCPAPDVPQAAYLLTPLGKTTLHNNGAYLTTPLEEPTTHDNGTGVGQLILNSHSQSEPFFTCQEMSSANIPATEVSNTTFDSMLFNIIEKIIKLLDPKSLMYMTQVNKGLKRIAKKELKKLGAQLLQHHNNDPQAALFDAIRNNKPWAVPYLIKKGANINANDENGEPPLIIATNHNNKTIVKQLIKAGAYVFWDRNPTALDLAIANNNREIVRVLFYEVSKNIAWDCCDFCCCNITLGGLGVIICITSLILAGYLIIPAYSRQLNLSLLTHNG